MILTINGQVSATACEETWFKEIFFGKSISGGRGGGGGGGGAITVITKLISFDTLMIIISANILSTL